MVRMAAAGRGTYATPTGLQRAKTLENSPFSQAHWLSPFHKRTIQLMSDVAAADNDVVSQQFEFVREASKPTWNLYYKFHIVRDGVVDTWLQFHIHYWQTKNKGPTHISAAMPLAETLRYMTEASRDSHMPLVQVEYHVRKDIPRRYDKDRHGNRHGPYTEKQFFDFYGNRQKWNNAERATPRTIKQSQPIDRKFIQLYNTGPRKEIDIKRKRRAAVIGLAVPAERRALELQKQQVRENNGKQEIKDFFRNGEAYIEGGDRSNISANVLRPKVPNNTRHYKPKRRSSVFVSPSPSSPLRRLYLGRLLLPRNTDAFASYSPNVDGTKYWQQPHTVQEYKIIYGNLHQLMRMFNADRFYRFRGGDGFTLENGTNTDIPRRALVLKM